MISAPLLTPFGITGLPAGGNLSLQTPYGTASVRQVKPFQPADLLTNPAAPSSPSDPSMVGGVSSPVNPQVAPQPAGEAGPMGGGMVNNPAPSVPVGQAQGGSPNIAPPSNSVQRWQQAAMDKTNAQTSRFYARKEARDDQATAQVHHNYGAADAYRESRRITPGANNIYGYGTPASPETNVGAIPQPEFIKSNDWASW